jgi:hypothetical protein
VRYDATKIRWIGSTTKEFAVVAVWGTAPQMSFSDTLKQETILGSVGVSGDTDLYPRVFNNTLGTKFKIVGGYPGQSQILLAMQRGEVQGTGYWSWTDLETRRSDWLKDRTVRPLLQLGLTKSSSPYLKDVPLIMDVAPDHKTKEVFRVLMSSLTLGRPFFVAPEVPDDRAAILRKAFTDTMNDSAFQEEATRTLGELGPVSGEEMQKIIGDIFALPSDVIESLRAAVR